MELNLFEEAITWCDQGLAVSFGSFMLKTRAAVFYRVLDPIKYVLRVFERLQKHSWKSVCQESS